MPMCKVWNDNIHPYDEKFKGRDVVIEPKSFIEMDLDEAHQFLGTMGKAPKKKGDGTPDERCFKMLRIEAETLYPEAPVNPLVIHAEGTTAANQAEFNARLKQFEHMLAKSDDKIGEDKAAALQSEVDELKEQVAALLAEKSSKRGRPRKSEEEAEGEVTE